MTNKRIIDLPALTVQNSNDLSETSKNGSGSYKETRTQQLNYINSNAQLASTSQVTGLDADLASKLNKDFSTLTPVSAALTDLLAVNNGESITATQLLSLINTVYPLLVLTTNYTLIAADQNKLLWFAVSGSVTLNLPTGSSIPNGKMVRVFLATPGTINITCSGGFLVGQTTLSTIYSYVDVYKADISTWSVQCSETITNGAVAGTYGSSTATPIVTVTNKGLISSITSTPSRYYVTKDVSTSTLSVSDNSKFIRATTDTGTITLPAASSAAVGAPFFINNISSGFILLQTDSGSDFIDGMNAIHLQPYESIGVVSDGVTKWNTIHSSRNLRQIVTTTNNSFTYLTNNSNYITIAVGRVVKFKADIIGSQFNTNGCAFTIEGCISNFGGTTAFIGTPIITTLGKSNVNYDVNVVSDNATDTLRFEVKGDTSQTVNWCAYIDCKVII